LSYAGTGEAYYIIIIIYMARIFEGAERSIVIPQVSIHILGKDLLHLFRGRHFKIAAYDRMGYFMRQNTVSDLIGVNSDHIFSLGI